jgi:hypothetical protein
MVDFARENWWNALSLYPPGKFHIAAWKITMFDYGKSNHLEMGDVP